MKCKKIMAVLEHLAPKMYAESWDNVGLLIGDVEKKVERIMIAVDASDLVVEEAVSKQADMLITHHPMIFSGLKSIRKDDFIGRRVIQIIKEDIAYYAFHTNFDIAGGMAELAANKLGLINTKVLEKTTEIQGEEAGIGRIGYLNNQMNVKDLSAYVKECFGLDSITVYGDLDSMVSEVAISPGSGKREIDFAVKEGVQVLITGDIGHHEGMDANAKGIVILDAGHFGLEKIFSGFLKEYLKENLLEEIEIMVAKERNPFLIL
ncbi:MAG: Nif3-like dinuclear metal center hexameric protein [Clostridiales bacterium]|nr:Nif3-like dinuclear metal center hexameric protein [Clostridiales bacterium]